MRGADITQEALFTTAKLDDFVPDGHPLRAIRALTDQVLRRMSGLFSALYADTGRHSIAPEKLLRAQLLQLFYSLRSERMLMEQLRYNLLFRWFVGIALDEAVWDHSVFSKNRDRLNDASVAAEFLQEIVRLATQRGLMSDEHFSVDGTLLQAWASQKSFRPKDGPPDGGGGPRNAAPDFKGQKRKNDTHASTTDPDARLFRKGNTGAQLSYQGHVLMEHRSGLVRGACVSRATGHGERESALKLLKQLEGRRRRTLAADKAYDTADFVAACREAGVTPHVAQNTSGRRSAIDGRTTRHVGYALSLKTRAWIETHFGWIKAMAGMRQVKQRGLARVEALFQFAMAASNLVRLPKLLAAGAVA
ncbi:MAG: IS5 family transposase [Rhodanobacteraceae bacterium]|jgi:transposase|nr:IS5 family transposase [Rhodanobacteraceae bacterium]